MILIIKKRERLFLHSLVFNWFGKKFSGFIIIRSSCDDLRLDFPSPSVNALINSSKPSASNFESSWALITLVIADPIPVNICFIAARFAASVKSLLILLKPILLKLDKLTSELEELELELER
jgi:hypothetical protein